MDGKSLANRLFIGLALFAVCVVGAGALWAGTTGQIRGMVFDSEDQGLPGAQVTIESESLIGGVRTAVAGAGGTFQLPALPPGVYKVTVVMDGFVTQELGNVKVYLDQTSDLRLQLSPASFAGEITVSGEAPVINTAQSNLGQAYTAEFLQGSAVSTENRDYLRAIGKTAGVLDSTGYWLYVHGSGGNENAYYIDGLNNNNPVDLGGNTDINFDAIDEVSVQTAGFNAEYGYSIGGVFNVVTKSGGNKFSGSFDARYTDQSFLGSGDHFDPGDQEYSFGKFAATLGGPILRDKLWFFASFDTNSRTERPEGVQQTGEYDQLNIFGKLTWQISDKWRMIWKSGQDDYDQVNKYADYLTMPEADLDLTYGSTIHQLEAIGALSDSVFLTLQAGTSVNPWLDTSKAEDPNTFSHWDQGSGVASRNSYWIQDSDDSSDQLRGDLSWFVDSFGGSHEFKAGFDFSNQHWDYGAITPGDFVYLDFFGFPYALGQITLFRGGTSDAEFRSVYVQDAWRPHPNLTLNFGVRYDLAEYTDLYLQEGLDPISKTQPRVGLAWDATGDGKTVVRGFWGEFMHPSGFYLPGLTVGPYTGVVTYLDCSQLGMDNATCEYMAPILGSRYIEDPGHYPGVGWFLVAGSENPTVIEDGLISATTEQWNIGVEREIFRNTSLGLQYVKKDTTNLFDTTCNGNIPTPSEGADCSWFVVSNSLPLYRDYEGWMLTFKSRASSKISLQANYTYSNAKGTIGTTQGNVTDFDYYPDNFVNRYGYLENHRLHQFKVNGFWLLPLRFSLGFDLLYQSAFPWTPVDNMTEWGSRFAEPRGSRDGDPYTQLNLQFSKAFGVGGTWDLELILSVLNVTNAENALAVCNSIHGCTTLEAGEQTLVPMGDSLAWQLPRRFELGVRITF